jgi:hypothetical protein
MHTHDSTTTKHDTIFLDFDAPLYTFDFGSAPYETLLMFYLADGAEYY